VDEDGDVGVELGVVGVGPDVLDDMHGFLHDYLRYVFLYRLRQLVLQLRQQQLKLQK
jgi:hypothetical protein